METRRMYTRNADEDAATPNGVVIEPYRGPERAVQVQFPTSVQEIAAADNELPPEVHWPADDGKGVDAMNWAWIGIATHFASIPAWLAVGLVNLALTYVKLVIPVIFIIAAISVIGLLLSLRSLSAARRSPQPAIGAALSLVGIGIAMFVLLYIVPHLTQLDANLINYPFNFMLPMH